MINQQNFAGMTVLTFMHDEHTIYLSMHSGTQQGMQHRQPVPMNRISPHSSAVLPTVLLSKTPAEFLQKGQAVLFCCWMMITLGCCGC